MIDLEFYETIGKKVDWNTNDFELVDAIKIMAEHFIGALGTMKDTVPDFERVFATVADQKAVLQNYSSLTTEANYIDKAVAFLDSKEAFTKAIKSIIKAQKFIKKNFVKVKEFKHFAAEVVSELTKADKTNDTIAEAQVEFNALYQQDLVTNFAKLQELAQSIKDEYFRLMKSDVAIMTANYQALQMKVAQAEKELSAYPPELNTHNAQKLKDLQSYCSKRIVPLVEMEYSIECKSCNYSLSEVLNYIQLVPTKESDLMIVQSSFVKEKKPEPTPGEPPRPKEPKKVRLNLSKTKMSVGEYRTLLTSQLQALAGSGDDEQIELTIDEQ